MERKKRVHEPPAQQSRAFIPTSTEIASHLLNRQGCQRISTPRDKSQSWPRRAGLACPPVARTPPCYENAAGSGHARTVPDLGIGCERENVCHGRTSPSYPSAAEGNGGNTVQPVRSHGEGQGGTAKGSSVKAAIEEHIMRYGRKANSREGSNKRMPA